MPVQAQYSSSTGFHLGLAQNTPFIFLAKLLMLAKFLFHHIFKYDIIEFRNKKHLSIQRILSAQFSIIPQSTTVLPIIDTAKQYFNLIQRFGKLKMDWNEMSDDSWLQSDESDEEVQKLEENTTKAEEITIKTEPNLTKNTNIEIPQKNEQIKKQKDDRKQGKKENRKFPTDRELLEQYQKGEVQQSKRIKIINFNPDEKKMIENMLKDKKIKKIRPLKENILTITFWKQQDLIKFIENKIEESYKFKIGVYLISEKEKQWKAEKQKEKEKQKQKQKNEEKKKDQKKDERQHKGKKQQYREKYDIQSDKKQEERKEPRKKWDEQNRKDKEKKENPKPKADHKYENKVEQKYKEKDNQRKRGQLKSLHLESERSNIITVISDEGSPGEVIQWLKNKQLTKQFSEFFFRAPGKLLDYMQKICQQCHKALKYGLVSDISEQQCQNNTEGMFEFKVAQQKKPKQIKRLLAGVYIERAGQQYFETSQKFNTHIIGSKKNVSEPVDFDEKDYIESFKKSYPKLVTKWDKWIFYAYGKNVAKLLRLSGKMKKLLEKNQFAYEIGSTQKVPYVRFEISDFNKTKYKVDTSLVNSHLQDA